MARKVTFNKESMLENMYEVGKKMNKKVNIHAENAKSRISGFLDSIAGKRPISRARSFRDNPGEIR